MWVQNQPSLSVHFLSSGVPKIVALLCWIQKCYHICISLVGSSRKQLHCITYFYLVLEPFLSDLPYLPKETSLGRSHSFRHIQELESHFQTLESSVSSINLSISYPVKNFPPLQLAPDWGVETTVGKRSTICPLITPTGFLSFHPYPQGCFWFFQGEHGEEGGEGMGHASLNRPSWCCCSYMAATQMLFLSQATLVRGSFTEGNFPPAALWCRWFSLLMPWWSWLPAGRALCLPLVGMCPLPPGALSPLVRANWYQERVVNQAQWALVPGKIIRLS